MTDVLTSPSDSVDSGTTPAPTPAPAQTTPSRNPLAIAVACVALLVFGGLIIYLFSLLGLQEPQWSRALYLLNGVEAVAFAAAGFLFGREVNRGRAENAEQRANQAQDIAQEKAQEARNLAVAVVESAAVAGPRGARSIGEPETEAAPGRPALSLALDVLRRSR